MQAIPYPELYRTDAVKEVDYQLGASTRIITDTEGQSYTLRTDGSAYDQGEP